MQDDLPKLAEAVRLSRAAERIIKQNVAVSLAIKGVFVLLAPSPWWHSGSPCSPTWEPP